MKQKKDLFDGLDHGKKELFEGLGEAMLEYIDNMSDDERVKLLESLNARMLDLNKITTKDWSATHPLSLTCGGDKYYANLANELYKKIGEYPIDLGKFPIEELYGWSKTLAAYLEDFVSDTHIWDSFRNMYKAKYGKWLPFYDTDHDDYFTDDINIEDVKFLLWQCIARNGQRRDIFNSPYSPAIDTLAQGVFPTLVDAVEKAPRAMRVLDYLRKSFAKGDIHELREISHWLVVRNPIFYDMYFGDFIEGEVDEAMSLYPEFDKDFVRYATVMPYSWQDYFGPMGCKSSAYMAEIARCMGYAEIAGRYADVDSRYTQRYNVKEVSSDFIVAVDGYGNEYNVEKSSFEKGVPLAGMKAFGAALMGVSGNWMINGIAMLDPDKPFSKEMLREGVTKDMLEKSPHTVAENRRIIQENGGCRVFGFKTVKDVSKFLGDSAFLPLESEGDKKVKSVVLLLSDTGSRYLVPDGMSIFKLKGNRHYSKKACERDGLIVPMSYTIDEDVAHYIKENNLMPDMAFYTSQGGDLGHKTMQENMEFIFGFLRDNPRQPSIDSDLDDLDEEA